MGRVVLTPEARRQMRKLSGGMLRRINDVLFRLESWPRVSGAKPLRGDLVGSYRIRCGDWRVLFRTAGDAVVVFRIDNRRDVYQR